MNLNKILIVVYAVILVVNITYLILLHRKMKGEIDVCEYPEVRGFVCQKNMRGMIPQVLVAAKIGDELFLNRINDFVLYHVVKTGDQITLSMIVYKDTKTGKVLEVMMGNFKKA